MAAKPIPTRYGGVLFRSRLEARWAVFFDELRLKWEYEPQGYETTARYLPDFAVFAALGILWAEVKPGWLADPDGVARFREFAIERPQPSRAVLLAGTPRAGERVLVIGGDVNAEQPVQGPWEDDGHEWRPCPGGHHFDVTWPGTFRSKLAGDGCEPCASDAEERLEHASAAARSHRFGRPGAAA